jgi:hypothetical protein
MSVTIPQRDLRRLMNCQHRIAAFHGRGSRDRVTKAVGDDFGPEIAGAIASLARQRLIEMDSVSAAILPTHGINPAVVAALRAEIHVFTVKVDWEDVLGVERDTHVRIGTDEIWWYPARNQITGLAAVPETIIPELAGRPLTHLLSHPALDALPLTIDEVEVRGTTTVTVRGVTSLRDELERYSRPLSQREKP